MKNQNKQRSKFSKDFFLDTDAKIRIEIRESDRIIREENRKKLKTKQNN